MEQVLKILKQLMGTAGMLGNIPKPIRVSMLWLAGIVGILVIFKYAKLGTTEKTFLIIAIALLGVITGCYYAWKGLTQKKQNNQFGGEISQHSSVTHGKRKASRGIPSPNSPAFRTRERCAISNMAVMPNCLMYNL